MLGRSLLRLPPGGQSSGSTRQLPPSPGRPGSCCLQSHTHPCLGAHTGRHTRPLTHTPTVTLGHGGTCPPAQHTLTSTCAVTLHRHLRAEGHPQAWEGWGYGTDVPLPPTHHSAISSQTPQGQTRRWAHAHVSRVFKTPREVAAQLGAPSSARSVPLQLVCETVVTPLTLGSPRPGPLSCSVKFRVSFLKCLHSVSE